MKFAPALVAAFLALPAAAQNAPMQLQPNKPAAKHAPAARPVATSDREAIEKANSYLNAANMMTADFVQIGGDGRRSEGKLYIQRPGLMRFEYARPATLEVIADGRSVAVRDRKLATQDLYLIGQTPLKFLLKDRIDISRDTKVLDVEKTAKSVMILIEDKATFGGTSRIRLVFDPGNFALKQWTVSDPQGADTVVSLFNVDTTKKPDPALFRIDEQRMRETR